MNKPKVFITQETNHNFTKAESFGDVEFLTREDLNNTKDSLHNEHLLAGLSHKLRKFDENTDWLVITGSPYVACAVFLILGHRKIRNIKVLRWDNRDYRYIPMYIDLRQEITNG